MLVQVPARRVQECCEMLLSQLAVTVAFSLIVSLHHLQSSLACLVGAID